MSDWPIVPIRSVVDEKETWNFLKEKRSHVEYLEISGIDNVSGKVIKTKTISTSNPPSRAKRVIRSGDVVFGTTRPYLKNIAVIPDKLENQICSSGFCVLRPKPNKTLTNWLYAVCRSDFVIDQVIPGQEKHAYPAINDDAVLNTLIPLPSIDEQHRIAARIKDLTSRMEEVRKLRQKATEQSSNTIIAFIDRLLFDLPKEIWKPIGIHAKLQGGYAFKSEWFSEEGMPLLRNQNIYHDEIDWSESKTVYLPHKMTEEFGRYLLYEGDVVLSMDRPLIATGLKASRIRRKDLPCLLLQRVGRFLCSEKINRDYLFLCLLSRFFTQQVSRSERSNAVPHISSSQVEAIFIPVPELDTQLEIVEKVEFARTKLRQIMLLQNETSTLINIFQAALLAKAFRGEL